MTKEFAQATSVEPTQNLVDTSSSNPAPATSTAPVVNAQVSDTKTTPTTPVTIDKASPKGVIDSVVADQKIQEEYWKDDWKDRIAGEDEKMRKLVDKYKTPKDLADAHKALLTEFSKTRPLKELGENPTKEDVTKYREERGIPESWEKYDTKLDNGIVIGELDKPIVDAYLKEAHSKNFTPSEVKKSLQTYFEVQQKETAALTERRTVEEKQAIDNLNKEWGQEFKGNVNAINTYLEKSLGVDVAESLKGAVLSDGSLLQNHPKLLNYFLENAKKDMNKGTLLPNSSNDVISLKGRKDEIEKFAATNPKEYYNNPQLREELARISVAIKR